MIKKFENILRKDKIYYRTLLWKERKKNFELLKTEIYLKYLKTRNCIYIHDEKDDTLAGQVFIDIRTIYDFM